MSTLLIAIFILSLAIIVLRSLADARAERLGPGSSKVTGLRTDWSEVARELDLELVSGSDSKQALRGTVSGHWVTVEKVDTGVSINMNYHSGVAPFTVIPTGKQRDSFAVANLTGDEAFDGELVVETATPGELDDYLSPARRNALLWLTSAFEVDTVSDEHIRVLFTQRRANAESIISAVRLVEDIAGILDEGEKVFMTPPLAVTGDDLTDTADAE